MRITFERKHRDISKLEWSFTDRPFQDNCEVHLNERRVPEHLEKAILYLADTKGEHFLQKVLNDVGQIEKECWLKSSF